MHACIYPRTSPFRSTVSQLVHYCLRQIFQSTAFDSIRALLVSTSQEFELFSYFLNLQYPGGYPKRRKRFRIPIFQIIRSYADRISFHIVRSLELDPSSELPDSDPTLLGTIYHKVVKETYDDESLDQATAALPSMLRSDSVYWHPWNILSNPEIQTLLHKLGGIYEYIPVSRSTVPQAGVHDVLLRVWNILCGESTGSGHRINHLTQTFLGPGFISSDGDLVMPSVFAVKRSKSYESEEKAVRKKYSKTYKH